MLRRVLVTFPRTSRGLNQTYDVEVVEDVLCKRSVLQGIREAAYNFRSCCISR